MLLFTEKQTLNAVMTLVRLLLAVLCLALTRRAAAKPWDQDRTGQSSLVRVCRKLAETPTARSVYEYEGLARWCSQLRGERLADLLIADDIDNAGLDQWERAFGPEGPASSASGVRFLLKRARPGDELQGFWKRGGDLDLTALSPQKKMSGDELEGFWKRTPFRDNLESFWKRSDEYADGLQTKRFRLRFPWSNTISKPTSGETGRNSGGASLHGNQDKRQPSSKPNANPDFNPTGW